MHSLSIVGTTWRTGGTAAVSGLTLAEGARREAVREIGARLGADEIFYLATCNRVEIVLLRSSRSETDPAQMTRTALEGLAGRKAERGALETLQSWHGADALDHLFSVACGLDSAQPGEVEIRAQLKRALSSALEADLCGPTLEGLVGQALTSARRVHRRTKIGVEKRSLANVAVELATNPPGQNGTHGSNGAPRPPIAVVGVSTTTRKCLDRLARAGHSAVVVNRTVERAHSLIADLASQSKDHASLPDTCHAISLEEFRESPPAVSALITAVSSTRPVLDRGQLARLVEASPKIPTIVDLGVPANISHNDAVSLGIRRLGMDEINRRAQETSADRQQALELARVALDEELARYRESSSHQSLSPVMRGLGAQTRETLREGVLEILRCSDVATASDSRHDNNPSIDDRIDQWVERMAKRMSHVPFVGLRALAASHGPKAVESFLEAADPVLAAEYRSHLGEAEPIAPRRGR